MIKKLLILLFGIFASCEQHMDVVNSTPSVSAFAIISNINSTIQVYNSYGIKDQNTSLTREDYDALFVENADVFLKLKDKLYTFPLNKSFYQSPYYGNESFNAESGKTYELSISIEDENKFSGITTLPNSFNMTLNKDSSNTILDIRWDESSGAKSYLVTLNSHDRTSTFYYYFESEYGGQLDIDIETLKESYEPLKLYLERNKSIRISIHAFDSELTKYYMIKNDLAEESSQNNELDSKNNKKNTYSNLDKGFGFIGSMIIQEETTNIIN